MVDRQKEIPHGPKELIRKNRIDSRVVGVKQARAEDKAGPRGLFWIGRRHLFSPRSYTFFLKSILDLPPPLRSHPRGCPESYVAQTTSLDAVCERGMEKASM